MPSQLDQLVFVLLVKTAIDVIDDFENPHGLSFQVVQGNCQQRVGSIPTAGIDAAVDLVGQIRSVPSARLLTLEDRSSDPLVVGDAKGFALHSQSGVADEFP